MRVWLPDCIYKHFPLLVGGIGVLGSLAGTPESIGLGGTLIAYSGGVFFMRRR